MSSVSASIIYSVYSSDSQNREPFDFQIALNAAIKNIKSVMKDKSIALHVCLPSDTPANINAGISPDHFIYLITSAVCALISSDGGDTVKCTADFAENNVRINISASAEKHITLPYKPRLLDLEEMIPSASRRLFICEFICSENRIDYEIIT